MKLITFAASLIAAAVMLTASSLPALAQSSAPVASTPNLDKRQANQEQRIEKGVQSGALTTKETANLEKRETRLEADKQAAKADGKVTRAEHRKLRREANRDSRKIYRKKHNANTSAPAAAAK